MTTAKRRKLTLQQESVAAALRVAETAVAAARDAVQVLEEGQLRHELEGGLRAAAAVLRDVDTNLRLEIEAD